MRPIAAPAALVVAAAIALLGCSGSSSAKRVNGTITKGGDLQAAKLQPGDCMLAPTKITANVTTVHAVPCKDPHPMEAYQRVTYDQGDAYPGDKELGRFADGACLEHYSDYVGSDYQDSTLFYTYLLPTAQSWQNNKDRTIICVITTTGQQLTGSVKGSQK